MATLVPMCSALLSACESVEEPPRTKNEPMIDATMPTNAIANGYINKLMTLASPACDASTPAVLAPATMDAKATNEIGAMIEPL